MIVVSESSNMPWPSIDLKIFMRFKFTVMSSPLRLLVIHPIELFREGIKHILHNCSEENEYELHNTDTIQNGIVMLECFNTNVLIVNLEAFEKEFRILNSRERTFISTFCVIAFANSYNDYLFSEFRFKAILLRSCSVQDLKSCIRSVSAECALLNRNELGYQGNTYLQDVMKITKREKEIWKLVMKNLSSKEISRKLFLSERTVETHRYNVLRKLRLAKVELIHSIMTIAFLFKILLEDILLEQDLIILRL
ncbi:helix-turn-helix transcriptional regulator [Niabella aquatica]